MVVMERACWTAAIALMLASMETAAGQAPGTGAARRASEVVTSFVSGTSPTLILGLDNNLDLCLASREWASPQELERRGISSNESQRALLRVFGLIERRADGRFRCLVPAITGPQAEMMRTDASALANDLVSAHVEAVRRFVAMARSAGAADQAYAILASFVLDGLMWDELRGFGLMGHADAMLHETGSEHWTGYAWITIPSRPASLGTNRHEGNGADLYVTWTPASLQALAPVSSTPILASMLDLSTRQDRKADSSLATALRGTGVLRDDALGIPVIAASSELHGAATALAKSVAAAYATRYDHERFGRLTGVRDTTLATLIFYHEVYPAMLAALVDREAIEAPVFFMSGQPLADVRRALFVVQRGAGARP